MEVIRMSLLLMILCTVLVSSLAAPTKIGVYFDTKKERVDKFETYLGKQLDYVRAANGWGDWDDLVNSASWVASYIIPPLRPREAVWSIALFPWNCATAGMPYVPCTLREAANGTYDGYYQKLADNIAKNTPGNSPIWVIPGYEFNGNWFPWKATWGQELLFASTFRHVVTAFRSKSNRFKFILGSAESNSITNSWADVTLCFPGREYVDAIGVNFYVKFEYQGTNVRSIWNEFLTAKVGLTSQKRLADSYGIPFVIPEIGFHGNTVENGTEVVDLTYVVEQFGTWIQANDVPMVIYWDGYSAKEGYQGVLVWNLWPKLEAATKSMLLKISSSAPTVKPSTPAPATPAPSTPAPSTPAPSTPAPAKNSYSANLYGSEANSYAKSGYVLNNFVGLVAANTIVSNGVMTLQMNTNGCPASCYGANYATGSWSHLDSFGSGTYAFSAQGPTQLGSVLTLSAAQWSENAAILILLTGSNRQQVTFATFINGVQRQLGPYSLSFDHSAGYNTYSFVRSAEMISFYVNNAKVASTTSQIPANNMDIQISYEAHSSWWGTFSYTGPSSVKIRSISFQPPTPSPYATVFDDALRGCWRSISYGDANYNETAFMHTGSKSISMQVGNWMGIYVECSSNVPVSEYNAITFWATGGNYANQKIRIQHSYENWKFGSKQIILPSPPVNSWQQYTLTFAQLGVGSTLKGFMIQSNTDSITGRVYVDDVQLINV